MIKSNLFCIHKYSKCIQRFSTKLLFMAKFYILRINSRYTIHAFTYLHVHYNNYDISKHFFDDLEKEIGCIRQNVQFTSKKLFLRIYNIVGKKLHTLQGHSSSMELYSALGNSYFLSKTLMDTEETFRVWDTTSFRCVTSFRHDNYVSMIHYLHLTLPFIYDLIPITHVQFT